jgi:hypothetical protein
MNIVFVLLIVSYVAPLLAAFLAARFSVANCFLSSLAGKYYVSINRHYYYYNERKKKKKR